VVSIDYSLGIQIINFLLLIFILNILLYKPILGLLDKRKREAEESEAEVGRLQESINQKMAAYEEKLQLAKAEALAMKKDLIKQGDDEAKALIDAAKSDIPGMQEAFRLKTADEIASARKLLIDNSRKLSVEIAEKIMGRGF
jgi:F-type H+-transporting ATPase subunit b